MHERPNGALLHNLILFGRLLRALGLDVNPGRMIDLAQALEHVEIGRRADFYYTARSLLVHRRQDLPLFDDAFNRFWRVPAGAEFPVGSPFQAANDAPQIVALPAARPDSAGRPPAGADDDANAPEAVAAARAYSRRELLRHKDFSEMTADELQAVRRLMAGLVWDLGQRRTRRRRAGWRGRQPDLRRAFRRSLRTGGELLAWPRREPKFKPRPLVVLADVSGSMEPYSRLLLHFIYSLAGGVEQKVEAFVFSTRLTRITRQLRGRDLDRALAQVAREAPDWGGGTRIGDALKTFNFEWGRRVLGRGAVALLISDGWDRGDPALLGAEMGRLRRSCRRLIWLNPLLGSARYEPLTRGMQAALPHIDDFLPVHNLASLEDLAEHLALLTVEKRPSRRTHAFLSGAAFIGRKSG